MHAPAIGIGNFFFRYRNGAFPIVVVLLYALAVPPNQLFGSEALEEVKDLFALGVALLGLALRATVIGYAYIKRGGKKKRVYAGELVTEGMFALSRNPLYLGNILICCGTFLMHGNIFVMLTGIAFYVLVYQCIVLAEEAYLLEKFGDAYRAYCADVPRWIPRFSRFREATEDMEFDVGRVVFKDYTTIATTVTVLALTEAYESLALPQAFADLDYELFLALVVVLCGIATLLVQAAKKRASALRKGLRDEASQ